MCMCVCRHTKVHTVTKYVDSTWDVSPSMMFRRMVSDIGRSRSVFIDTICSVIGSGKDNDGDGNLAGKVHGKMF